MEINNEQMTRWEAAKEYLRANLDPFKYRTWIEPLALRAMKGDTMALEASNPINANILKGRFYVTLAEAVKRAFGREITINIGTAEDIGQLIENLTSSMALNRSYTFDNFVVGHSNSFAYSAAVAVAESPSEQGAYNPLFIYGGVGLGKTHLMNAIGNYIAENSPELNVLYMSSETFTNDFIGAIKKRGTEELLMTTPLH